MSKIPKDTILKKIQFIEKKYSISADQIFNTSNEKFSLQNLSEYSRYPLHPPKDNEKRSSLFLTNSTHPAGGDSDRNIIRINNNEKYSGIFNISHSGICYINHDCIFSIDYKIDKPRTICLVINQRIQRCQPLLPNENKSIFIYRIKNMQPRDYLAYFYLTDPDEVESEKINILNHYTLLINIEKKYITGVLKNDHPGKIHWLIQKELVNFPYVKMYLDENQNSHSYDFSFFVINLSNKKIPNSDSKNFRLFIKPDYYENFRLFEKDFNESFYSFLKKAEFRRSVFFPIYPEKNGKLKLRNNNLPVELKSLQIEKNSEGLFASIDENNIQILRKYLNSKTFNGQIRLEERVSLKNKVDSKTIDSLPHHKKRICYQSGLPYNQSKRCNTTFSFLGTIVYILFLFYRWYIKDKYFLRHGLLKVKK